GQFSGILGPKYEPVMVRGTLDKPLDLAVPQCTLPADIDAQRMGGRRGLLQQLDAWQRHTELSQASLDAHDAHQRKPFALLTSGKAKRAFDLENEPLAVRQRYGCDINGQSVLMARRLVEAGVPFVCVHWLGRQKGAGILGWDTHVDNFGELKNVLLPPF